MSIKTAKNSHILIAIFIVFTNTIISAHDECEKSCMCFYDGQHFVMNCARTDLNSVPSSAYLVHTEYMDISHNNISNLIYDNRTFVHRNLRVLKAQHNAITALTVTFLKSVPHLTYLDLSHNKITQLDLKCFEYTPSVHYLDLSFNNIDQLPEKIFAPFKNLRHLDLSYNSIGQHLLQYESLNSSRLGFVDKIETLRLNAINLTSFSNRFLDNLTISHLSLADNDMKTIPLLPETLQSLDLSGNLYMSIAARDLTFVHLKKLHLNRLPNLEILSNYAFYNLISLEEIEIEHCPKLKEFNDIAFGVLFDKEIFNVSRISIRGNGLRALNESYFYLFNKAKQVDISDNPWICDCGVTWMKLVKNKFVNSMYTRCVTPRKLRNQELLNLSEDQLPKCNIRSHMRMQKILTSVICILVVVLLCVIMYLIYLAPYRGNQTSRFLGNQSPYNGVMVIQDDEHY